MFLGKTGIFAIIMFIIFMSCTISVLKKDEDNFAIKAQEEKSVENVPDGYIGIYSEEDFLNIKNDISDLKLDKNYILMRDLDMKDYNFQGFGAHFWGIFDGNYHTINNLKIEKLDPTSDCVEAIFSALRDATVKNLTLRNQTMKITSNYNYMGGIARQSRGNTILEGINIIGLSIITSNTRNVNIGGLIGEGTANVSNCYVSGEIQAEGLVISGSNIGGLMGTQGIIKNSSTEITIRASGGGNIGGIAGSANSVIESYSKCNIEVNGDSGKIGGLVGNVSSTTTIDKCYAIGRISTGLSAGNIGGLIGSSNGAKISNV